MNINILIILFTVLILLFLFYKYDKYLNNEYYTEGKEIIEKLREKKSKDETFDSIKKYYINLERSKCRLESIENEFQSYEIGNYERVEACDGKNLESTKEGKFKDLEFENIKDTKATKPEIATTCSHLKAIKKAYDDGEEIAIIMEDDIIFSLVPYWKKSLGEILDSVPENLEILQLVKGLNRNPLNFYLQSDLSTNIKDQKIIKRKKTWYTGCYLILRKGMKKIIDKFFKNNKIFFNEKNIVADTELIYGFLNSYYLEQNLFPLDSFSFSTTIQKSNKNLYYETLQTLKFYNK